MKNVQTVTGTLEILYRMNNSVNGNPRFMIRVGNVKARTAVDTQIAYGITNHENKQVEMKWGIHYNVPTVSDIKGV
jgi:hypothetical protein